MFKKTEISAANAVDSSTSTSYVNLGISGSIKFTQAASGCVAGTFTSSAGNTAAGDYIRMQILLDGAQCQPLNGNFGFATKPVQSNSTSFFCGANVAAGTHTIQVQYHTDTGGEAEFFQRTLEVMHK